MAKSKGTSGKDKPPATRAEEDHPDQETSTPRESPVLSKKWMIGSILLGVFVATTWFALSQAPRLDPYQPVQTFSRDWWSKPLERNAFKRLPATPHNLQDIALSPDGQRAWTLDDRDTILTTRDGGKNWTPQQSRTKRGLTSVHFVDAQTGWAVGWGGVILATRDGGAKWTPQQSKTKRRLTSVHFVDAQTGWAVGVGGTILATRDGGTKWMPQQSKIKRRLTSVHFVDAQTGWAVGWGGVILATQDGGTKWTPQQSKIKRRLTSVHFVDAQTGWAVGVGGTILATQNGGTTWTPQQRETKRELISVHFVDFQTGWTVGDNGTILTTQNGGTTWTPQQSGTERGLRSVHFVDAQTGWTVGDNGTILATQNGGTTWQDRVHYKKYPAPWYFGVLFLTLGFVAIVAGRIREKIHPGPGSPPQSGVQGILYSDLPWQEGDPDLLNFGPIVKGLSRFLRNENTQPPLTVAITGKWGSGKSSFMNQLKADLGQHGYSPTVWFNAWHHQKEENLLASLLDTIRLQAVPSVLKWAGIRFRFRLLRTRLNRRPVFTLLVIGFLGLIYFATTHFSSLNTTLNLNKPEAGFISVVATALLFVFRGAKTFGFNPFQLLVSITGLFRVSEIRGNAGVRMQFAQDFEDVTETLCPRTLVLLIDDLDRCQPESIQEVLEAINFLVSTGKCYVILGMALEIVERSICQSFKHITETANGGSKVETEDGEVLSFAKRYLEKMINIEVPIPDMDEDQSKDILLPPEEPDEPTRKKPIQRLSLWNWVGVSLLVAAIIGASYLLLKKDELHPSSQAPAVQRAKASSKPQGQQKIADFPEQQGSGQQQKAEPPSVQKVATIQQTSPPTENWFSRVIKQKYVLLAILGSLTLLGLFLMRKPILDRLQARRSKTKAKTKAMVKDSPEFVEAVNNWRRLIQARNNTPRAIKRFMNRVRFFAMRLYEENGRPSTTEANLVALSVIHNYGIKFEDLSEDSFKKHKDGKKIYDAFFEALNEHKDWPPVHHEVELFKKICKGIRIN